MPAQLFPEWRKYTGTIKYPFADSSSLTNDEGYILLEGTFLDAALFPVGGGVGMHLGRVIIEHDLVTLWIGDRVNRDLASAEFDLVDPPDLLEFRDVYNRPAGVIVSTSERLGVFQSWEVGEHVFKPEQSEFAATVCFPSPEGGLRGILLEDGSFMAGDVWIVGDDGVVVREEEVEIFQDCVSRPHRVIRIDVVGDPLFRRRLCAGADLFDTPRFIKEIMIVHPYGSFLCAPDARGDIKITTHDHLVSDPALRVRTTVDGIKIEVAGKST